MMVVLLLLLLMRVLVYILLRKLLLILGHMAVASMLRVDTTLRLASMLRLKRRRRRVRRRTTIDMLRLERLAFRVLCMARILWLERLRLHVLLVLARMMRVLIVRLNRNPCMHIVMGLIGRDVDSPQLRALVRDGVGRVPRVVVQGLRGRVCCNVCVGMIFIVRR